MLGAASGLIIFTLVAAMLEIDLKQQRTAALLVAFS